jgi:hypothetical protein
MKAWIALSFLSAALLCCAMVQGYANVTEFCEDSQWDPAQPAFGSASEFEGERQLFLEFRDYFVEITSDVDLGNTTIEANVICQLNAKLTEKGFNNTVYSFTIIRSNGDITMDTGLGVNPAIDNHGGRYSLGKVSLPTIFLSRHLITTFVHSLTLWCMVPSSPCSAVTSKPWSSTTRTQTQSLRSLQQQGC